MFARGLLCHASLPELWRNSETWWGNGALLTAACNNEFINGLIIVMDPMESGWNANTEKTQRVELRRSWGINANLKKQKTKHMLCDKLKLLIGYFLPGWSARCFFPDGSEGRFSTSRRDNTRRASWDARSPDVVHFEHVCQAAARICPWFWTAAHKNSCHSSPTCARKLPYAPVYTMTEWWILTAQWRSHVHQHRQ